MSLTDMLLVFIAFVMSMQLLCVIRLGYLTHKHFHYLGGYLKQMILSSTRGSYKNVLGGRISSVKKNFGSGGACTVMQEAEDDSSGKRIPLEEDNHGGRYYRTNWGLVVCPFFSWTSENVEGLDHQPEDVNLTFCNHPDNLFNCVMNCNNSNCPLLKKQEVKSDGSDDKADQHSLQV